MEKAAANGRRAHASGYKANHIPNTANSGCLVIYTIENVHQSPAFKANYSRRLRKRTLLDA